MADESPLAVVMEGREAARTTLLTEQGAKDLANASAEILLYVSGAIGIAMAMGGMYYLWAHNQDGEASRRTNLRGVAMILIGGCMTIPAIMAAILPHAVLGNG